MLPACAGVYVITNTVNGHQYVGSSVNMRQRWFSHISFLKRGRSGCTILQNAWNKYGENAFIPCVLEFVDDTTQLVTIEQRHMDTLHPVYNARLIARSRLGMKNNPESVAKMRQALTGLKRTPEQRKRIGDAKRGQTRTPEQRDRIRQGAMNPSAEVRAKMRAAKAGVTPQKAINASIASRKGKSRPQAVIDRIAASRKARWQQQKESGYVPNRDQETGRFM